MQQHNGNGNGRAKLELLVNKPAKVKLLKDKPYEGSSTYGNYVLYSVEYESAEVAYFATEEAHDEIQAHGLKTGDELVLTKIAQQNGRRIVPRIKVEPLKKETVRTETPAKKPDSQVDGLKSVMELSVRDAVEITRSVQGVPFQTEDIQKIASCLFIARSRANGFAT